MNGKPVYGYLANCLGFHELGRKLLQEYVEPAIRKTGIEPLEPFAICGAFAPLDGVPAIDSYSGKAVLWKGFNRRVVKTNETTMKRCRVMTPVLDGSRDVDEGIADEARFFLEHGLGPIYALRTDFRLSENIGCCVHPHVEGVVEASGGRICSSMDDWLGELADFYKRLKQ